MFNKKDYREAISHLKASEATHQEVLNMANERNKKPGHTLPRVLLIAAIVSVLAVTASASEYVHNWFITFFFDRSENMLSTQQIEYIEKNVQAVNNSQTQGEWTVELRSALTDGTTAYIIIGVAAPENIDLSHKMVDGIATQWYAPGNGDANVLSSSIGVIADTISYCWREDGDNLDNTKNYVIQIGPNFERSTIDPFGSDVQWNIHIEDIVRIHQDEAYLQELLNGKYKDQKYFITTSEETERLEITETVAKGIWDFAINFSGSEKGIELITEPVTTVANILRKYGPNIDDYGQYMENVTITSFVLHPLSATVSYEECDGSPSFGYEDKFLCVVMKDGSRVKLMGCGKIGENQSMFESESPVILEDVDHILMADGTIIPMVEIENE